MLIFFRCSRLLSSFMLFATLAACATPPPATIAPRASSAETSAPPRVTVTPLRYTLPTSATLEKRIQSVESDRLIVTVSNLVGVGARHALSVEKTPGEGIYGARQYLLNAFKAIQESAPSARVDIWTEEVPLNLNGFRSITDNVICVLAGTDINAGVVVVSAHYDTILNSDYFNTQSPAPGANNGGSGVAVMLESARILAATPHRATLLFVAFTASETGRQGSTTFINKYLKAQSPPIIPRAVLNLDTLGRNRKPDGTPGPNQIRIFSADPNDSRSRQLARALRVVAGAYPDLPELVVQSALERSGRFGDHQSFSDAGIPAVQWVEAFEDSTRDHSLRDTVDALQPLYLISVTQTVITVASALSDGPDAPLLPYWQDTAHTILKWRPVPSAVGYILALRHETSLTFEQVLVTGNQAEFIWDKLSQYGVGALAAYDTNGQIGPFSPEFQFGLLDQR